MDAVFLIQKVLWSCPCPSLFILLKVINGSIFNHQILALVNNFLTFLFRYTRETDLQLKWDWSSVFWFRQTNIPLMSILHQSWGLHHMHTSGAASEKAAWPWSFSALHRRARSAVLKTSVPTAKHLTSSVVAVVFDLECKFVWNLLSSAIISSKLAIISLLINLSNEHCSHPFWLEIVTQVLFRTIFY